MFDAVHQRIVSIRDSQEFSCQYAILGRSKQLQRSLVQSLNDHLGTPAGHSSESVYKNMLLEYVTRISHRHRSHVVASEIQQLNDI